MAGSNQRWASDITGIQAWDGQRGRLAVILDCADRMVLAWRFSKKIRAEDLCELVREAVFQRFAGTRSKARGIELLSDNGPEYISKDFNAFLQQLGLLHCRTPRRSPESNGLVEAFFGNFKRDYVYQSRLENFADIERELPGWIMHYNERAPHGALGMRPPAQFYYDWMVKNGFLPV